MKPRFARERAPTCWDRCPEHDGKRCGLMGSRAPEGHVCEPWANTAWDVLRFARPWDDALLGSPPPEAGS